jgi:hypothetical protein
MTAILLAQATKHPDDASSAPLLFTWRADDKSPSINPLCFNFERKYKYLSNLRTPDGTQKHLFGCPNGMDRKKRMRIWGLRNTGARFAINRDLSKNTFNGFEGYHTKVYIDWNPLWRYRVKLNTIKLYQAGLQSLWCRFVCTVSASIHIAHNSPT